MKGRTKNGSPLARGAKVAEPQLSKLNEHLEIPERAVRKLSELLRSTDLAEIEYRSGEVSIRVRARETSAVVHAPSIPHASQAPKVVPTPKVEESRHGDLHVVRSPFVGTFYRSPAPGKLPYVEQGQSINKGQVLCIIEAMKIMNEIEADQSGVLEKIFVDEGSPVDFNAPLFGFRKGV